MNPIELQMALLALNRAKKEGRVVVDPRRVPNPGRKDNSEKSRKRRAKNLARGLCHCGRERREGYLCCNTCVENSKAWQRRQIRLRASADAGSASAGQGGGAEERE